MDTTAVSISDIISRKHSIKWRDYQLLKSIIRNAYNSKDLTYTTSIDSVRLSMFNYSNLVTERISIHTGYSSTLMSYTVTCYIS